MAEDKLISNLASLASPLPPPPEGDVLTAAQWTTLLAIFDTYIPSLSDLGAASGELKPYLSLDTDSETLLAYLAEKPSNIPEFKPFVQRKLGHYVPPSGLKGLTFILSSLDTRLGCLLFTSSPTSFHLHTLATRTAIIQGWSSSRLPLLRALFRSFALLAKQCWLAVSPNLHKLVRFPAVPAHIERQDSFKFQFHDIPTGDDPAHFSTDVVIVGSGCGAGVCAYNLSNQGYKVLVLEKGYHFPSSHFPMDQNMAAVHLMDNGGAHVSDDQSIAVLNGSTWGGGGTVNWSASLQPQHFVREEWSRSGLPFATSAEFQDCLDTVCDKMGVCKTSDEEGLAKIDQNFANQTLIEGARRLGYNAEVVPQNTGRKKHYCGYCGQGCSSATKQGPANLWLPAAAAKGAEFIEGCWIEEVIFEGSGKDRKASGVKGVWTSRDRATERSIIVKAKRVIVSAGTLQSPILLMRSGISNPHLGRNLHLHPVSTLGAIWPDEVRPWEGPILTAAVTSLENLDGLYHGPKLEVIASTPGLLLPFLPWRANLGDRGGLDFKIQCAKFHHTTGFISLQRDRDTGRVYIDPDDKERKRLKIEYTCSERDCKGIFEGLVAAARIACVMGAREIFLMNPQAERYVRDDSKSPEDNNAKFDEWVEEMRKKGLKVPDPCVLGSAHQMGTCRMGSTSQTGVVDQHGKVWGTSGLYVADASVFPSASGVNPMVTTMGLAEWISRGIIKEGIQ